MKDNFNNIINIKESSIPGNKEIIFNNNLENIDISKQKEINLLKEEIIKYKQELSNLEQNLLNKDLIIEENNIILKKIKEENENLMKENQNKEKTIKELNYKIIELEQNNKLNNTIQKLFDKNKEISKDIEQNNNLDNNVFLEKLNIENINLQNKVNEFEIKNSKLIFENQSLLNKIELQSEEHKREKNLLNFVAEKKLNHYTQEIESLKTKLSNELNKQKNEILNSNNLTNDNIIKNNEIYNKLNEMRNKINILDDENFNLKKEIEKINYINEELQIKLEGKEEILLELQNNMNNITSEINNNDKNIIINKNIKNEKDYKNIINNLLKENEELKINNENIINEINNNIGNNEDANKILERNEEYENVIILQQKKLKEYKYKISILKIKVNELHNELFNLKNNKDNFNISQNEQDQNKFHSPIQSILLNRNNKNDIKNNKKKIKNISRNYDNNVNEQNKIKRKKEYIQIEKFHNNSFDKSPVIIGQNNQKIKIHVETNEENINNENDIKNSHKYEEEEIKGEKNIIYTSEDKDINENGKFTETQEFINKNIDEDKKQLQFIKEYKETLNKVDEDINNLKI